MSATTEPVLEGMPGAEPLRLVTHQGETVVLSGRLVLFRFAVADDNPALRYRISADFHSALSVTEGSGFRNRLSAQVLANEPGNSFASRFSFLTAEKDVKPRCSVPPMLGG